MTCCEESTQHNAHQTSGAPESNQYDTGQGTQSTAEPLDGGAEAGLQHLSQ